MSVRAVTLITGASSGIGRELARVFARNGHDLALVARRKDRLTALAAEIEQSSGKKPIVIVADLGEPEALGKIEQALKRQRAEPNYVVNNAGFGLLGRAENNSRAEQIGRAHV